MIRVSRLDGFTELTKFGERRRYAALANLGYAALKRQDWPQAEAHYRRSFTLREALAKASPGDAGLQRDMAVGHNGLGALAEAQSKWDDALTQYRASLSIREALWRANLEDKTARRDMVTTQEKIAAVLIKMGRPADARTPLDSPLADAQRLLSGQVNSARAHLDLLRLRTREGVLLDAEGDHAAAERALVAVRSDAIAAADVGFPQDAQIKEQCVMTMQEAGRAIAAQGRSADAITVWREALTRAKALADGAPSNQEHRNALTRLEDLIKQHGPK